MRRRCRLDLFQVRQYIATNKKEGEELTIIIIITNNHLLNLPKLAHLAPKVLIKRIKVILQLTRIHLVLRIVGWVLVKVWEQDSLAVGGLDVFS